MRQRAATEAVASSIMYYILLVHSLAVCYTLSLSPITLDPLDRQRDRPAGRNAHCSLGDPIDPANHFIYFLINADSHLFPLSVQTPIDPRAAECMFDWKCVNAGKHTKIKKIIRHPGLQTAQMCTPAHAHRWTASDLGERQASVEERRE